MRAILNVIKTLGVKGNTYANPEVLIIISLGLYTAFSMDVLYIPGNVIYMVTYVYLKEFLQKLDNKYFGQKRAEKLQLQSINLQEQPHYQGN